MQEQQFEPICFRCQKEHDHVHIGFMDGVKHYRLCKKCCEEVGRCFEHFESEKKEHE